MHSAPVVTHSSHSRLGRTSAELELIRWNRCAVPARLQRSARLTRWHQPKQHAESVWARVSEPARMNGSPYGGLEHSLGTAMW